MFEPQNQNSSFIISSAFHSVTMKVLKEFSKFFCKSYVMLKWKLVNLSSSNISIPAGSKEKVENRCFIAGARKRETKCLCKLFCLCEQCAFAESLVCAKRIYFWCVSFNYQQSKSEKRQPCPNNLLQRRCPSAESPAPSVTFPAFWLGIRAHSHFISTSSGKTAC